MSSNVVVVTVQVCRKCGQTNVGRSHVPAPCSVPSPDMPGSVAHALVFVPVMVPLP